ncbi:MAG: metallophosphoesterase [Anaerolineales bacterium]
MKLAILSDTHDNLWALKAALPQMAAADAAIHCGDLCSPFMLKHLGEGMAGKPVHVVWGNNEGDVLLMTRVAAQLNNLHLHGALAELEFDGVRAGTPFRVAVNHYPEIAHGLALSGKYDVVCFGHNHIASTERVNQCLLLNPGELMGLMGRRTFALLDTQTRSAEFVEVPE